MHVSTDYVFDGLASRPYREEDAAKPISVYGKTKRLGEELLLQSSADHLVIRVSWVFGPDKPSFIDLLLDRAIGQEEVAAIDDKFSAPTYTVDFAQWIRPLLFELPIGGILHLCNSGGCSWREYAQCAVDAARQEKVQLKALRSTSDQPRFHGNVCCPASRLHGNGNREIFKNDRSVSSPLARCRPRIRSKEIFDGRNDCKKVSF